MSNSLLSQESWSGRLYTAADIAIIGAGLSGLTAAYRILKKDPSLRVIVLEAKDDVGGRTQTVLLKVAGGGKEPFDVGGQWVDSGQDDIMLLLDELEITSFPQYRDGKKVFEFGAHLKTEDNCFIPACSWYCRFQLNSFVRKVENIMKRINWNEPLEDPYVKELDSMTLETFLNCHLQTQLAVGIMKSFIQTCIGAESSQISALYFISFVNGKQGFINKLKLIFPGDDTQRIMNGAHYISMRLAEEIGDSLELGDNVIEVVQLDETVDIMTASQKLYRCQYAIMAIPPSEVQKIYFMPPLPAQHKKLLDHFPAGHMIKFVATYNEAFWREKELSGEAVSDGGLDPAEFPISMTYDLTTPGGHPAIGGHITGSQMDSFILRSAEKRKQLVLHHLLKLFGEEALRPIDYVEKNWCEELYIGGCPIQYLTPGVMSCKHFMRQPFIRVYWAGTEAAVSWFGYMNGAVQAGNVAALETLYQLRPQCLTALDLIQVHRCFPVTRPPSGIPWWLLWVSLGLIGVAYIAYRMYKR
ncbi:probable flavin-containing monoamine oxidase A [Schistocerca piceifrons]|uniref:probable flavin-containing monoamine oxidase A n=1 Tax=Schistocerca piceifrons TaxID=274613 RepID=UPI001F5EBB87|nr:probable flavin-containing monoamine oxidase A [Schistocerca piceifrons]